MKYYSRILIVGPHGSYQSLDITQPFWHGAEGAIFTNWLLDLGIFHYDLHFVNVTKKSYKVALKFADKLPWTHYDKVIALGSYAEAALIDQGCANYFWLPFPSPRTGEPPDNWYILDKLEKCREYLRRENGTDEIKKDA